MKVTEEDLIRLAESVYEEAVNNYPDQMREVCQAKVRLFVDTLPSKDSSVSSTNFLETFLTTHYTSYTDYLTHY